MRVTPLGALVLAHGRALLAKAEHLIGASHEAVVCKTPPEYLTCTHHERNPPGLSPAPNGGYSVTSRYQQARHNIPPAQRSVTAGCLPAEGGLYAYHHGSSSIAAGTGHRPDSHATRWRTSSVRCTRSGTVANSAGNSHATYSSGQSDGS